MAVGMACQLLGCPGPGKRRSGRIKSIPVKASSLDLEVLPGRFAICRLTPGRAVPAWAIREGFHSVTRTAEELSIVCLERHLPARQRAQRGWRLLRVKEPLEFSLTGILASLTGPLAAAGISIFSISTYETDYLLVKSTTLKAAVATLRATGHRIG